ncbi:hypothetical protein [Paractinoplanes brasiliensis]|uniref:PPE family protein n=1 Tax=Paractinoplanes brasiliensis TaxID=52695 RepID=A0A4R6JU56_9ACTN|nr:hypothetical protein [Actinoplanes brasiliensis]TDO40224.1 hypothetical protein C8E87_3935 [Actinoplanes brasiliensis]GID25290.1 hypothetical protein Abr02nite_02730 [Actinoplanes brasiliensis]
MLIAAGGGGAGGTPWGLMTMQDMQAYIQNPDTDQHYKLLTGWKRSADLINEHRWQVENYRDNLAAAWPPEKNAAAEAYITRLNELIANLEETYEAALANHDAFASATLSISLAQREMDELAHEYSANEQALAAYNAKPPTPSGQPSPTPSPSPSGEQPPVAPGRQEELHRKAVTLLNGVSADLAQAQVNVRTPTLYQPGQSRQDPPSGGDGTTYVPPPIPPITPSYEPVGGSGSSTRPSVPFPAPTASQPVVTSPTSQPGLILGGTNPQTVAPPATGIPTPPSQLPGSGPITNPGLIPSSGAGLVPTKPGFGPTGGTTIVPPTTGLNRGTGLPREGFGRSTAAGSLHVMPPGGMIGGAPGAGIVQPGASRSGVARVNPVGGVIGGGASSGTPGNRGVLGSNPGTALGPTGGRRMDRNNPSEAGTHWDPDNPWATLEGVAPVVLPPRQQRIDPGPAIGLG